MMPRSSQASPLLRRSALILLLAILGAAHGAAADSDAPAPAADGVWTAHPRLAKGVFLIARQGLNDPNFSRSVILITQYDDAGTVGLVINRTLPVRAVDAVPPIARLGLDAGELHAGGPVAIESLQLLIRASTGMDDATRILDDVHLVSELAALENLLDGGIRSYALRLYAGYAGWGPGQLESELLRGDWYLWPADPADIFTTPPDGVWPKLIQLAAAQWASIRGPDPEVAHWTGGSIMPGHLIGTPPECRPSANPTRQARPC